MQRDFSNLNEPQREAVFRINGNLLVLAGAGSGKTTVVINRIYNIIVYGDVYNNNLEYNEEIFDRLNSGFKNGQILNT